MNWLMACLVGGGEIRWKARHLWHFLRTDHSSQWNLYHLKDVDAPHALEELERNPGPSREYHSRSFLLPLHEAEAVSQSQTN